MELFICFTDYSLEPNDPIPFINSIQVIPKLKKILYLIVKFREKKIKQKVVLDLIQGDANKQKGKGKSYFV